MKEIVTLRINGETYEAAIEPRRTLLEVLRETLRLTGTKEVCDLGSCGACTVHLDGKPVLSCLTLAVSCRDQEVTTIEGLGSRDKLHPLQDAFIQNGAIQCGMCTPGFIMSAKALLDHEADPSEEEVKRAISGNLCRCTGYTKVTEAVLAAARSTGLDPEGRTGLSREGGPVLTPETGE
jgi:carbon-monoxide dehydrogenase small subunit